MTPRSVPGRCFAHRLLVRGGRDEESLRQDIIDNLRVLLGSRPGAPSAPSLGLESFNELAGQQADAVARLERQIHGVCSRFEPRLKDLAVSHVPSLDPGSLRFSLTGVICTPVRRAPFTISTAIFANNTATVEDR